MNTHRSTSSNTIKFLISMICNFFALKDLGTLHYFLGVEVSWTKDGNIHLSQSRYIKDLLTRTNVLDLKSQSSPMISSLRLIHDVSSVVIVLS